MSAGLLLMAFLRRRTGLAKAGTIPRLEQHRTGVRIDPATLARYHTLCGFPPTDHLPSTFPQMLAGDLHLALLADPRFPLPVAGIVHFQNRIVEHTPLPTSATYDLEAHIDGHRDDPRGVLFDIETRLHLDGATAWEATTTVLSRPRAKAKAKAEKAPKRRDDPPAGLSTAPLRTALFHLPEDLGRRYSALAGDYNPIHLTALTAKPFGFKKAIIHGMWTLARSLAEMSDDLPPPPRITTVRFERPVFLPGRAHLAVHRENDGLAYTLTSPDLRTRHLSGEVQPV